MKKFQKLMCCIAIVNFVIWFVLGVFSLYCAPSAPNQLGYYNDDCDGPTVEDLQTIAPEALKPAVVIYKPLLWLIEPVDEGQSGWFLLTMLTGLFVAVWLFFRIPISLTISTWSDAVKFTTDVLLNVYLFGLVSIVIYGIMTM